MKNTRNAALALGIILPLSFAFNSTATTIEFGPEVGLSLTKTFEHNSTSTLVGLSEAFDDQIREIEDFPELSSDTAEAFVFEDTYIAVADGQPQILSRHFAQLEVTKERSSPGGEMVTALSSALEGLEIVYTWDDEEGAYTAAYGEDVEDGDVDLLDLTECDADFLGFLPEGGVDEGDSWTVDTSAWKLLLDPGGNLSFLDEEDESDDGELDEEINESLDGEVTCTFEGTREDDGVTYAVIAITAELRGSGDEEEEIEAEGRPTATNLRKVQVEIEFEGELLWDLSAGHLSSLEILGNSTSHMFRTFVFQTPDGATHAKSQKLDFETEHELTVTFE